MSGILYLCATPIGNLGDISDRLKETLLNADLIAAEDTRRTLGLLSHLGIKKPLFSYHEHNRHEAGVKLINKLLGGETVALVSDAGTPCISDPGEELVSAANLAGIKVEAIPGPCAALCALALSGFDLTRFAFEGFLPRQSKERKIMLEKLKTEERTLAFYISPHKIADDTADLFAALGARRCTVCRELTKLHQELLHMTLDKAASYFKDNNPRGEFVLVVEGAPPREAVVTDDEIMEELRRHSHLTTSDAVKLTSEQTGVNKNRVYRLANNEKLP